MTPYALAILDLAREAIEALPEKDRSILEDALHIIQAVPHREGTRLNDELSGYRRLKKGRYRIFCKIDEPCHAVRILYVGFRKAGDRHDAYREFQRLFVRRRP